MATPTLHTHDTAPADAQPLLKKSQKAFGMIPNLHAVMAESPALLEAYQKTHELVVLGTQFSAIERTVVWQTVNVEHACHYCVPAHTAIAHMDGVHADIIEALRNGAPLGDERLEALRNFTLSVVRNRGQVSDMDRTAFAAAGFGDSAVLDVILIVSQKVMSNYVNNLFDTPVDAPFQKFAWEAEAAA